MMLHFDIYFSYNLKQDLVDTTKNTVILANFLVWEFVERRSFPIVLGVSRINSSRKQENVLKKAPRYE